MNLYVRCTTQFERPRTIQEMTVICYLICINYTRKYTFVLKARKHKCINVMRQWSLFNILRKPLNSSGNDSLYHLMQRRERPKQQCTHQWLTMIFIPDLLLFLPVFIRRNNLIFEKLQAGPLIDFRNFIKKKIYRTVSMHCVLIEGTGHVSWEFQS